MGSPEDLERLADGAPALDPIAPEPEPEAGAAAEPDQGERKSRADLLLSVIAKSDAELFHDAGGDAYVTFARGGHRETHRLKSLGAREWVRELALRRLDSGLRGEDLNIVIETLAARARFDGAQREVSVRVAAHQDAIYLDLGDASWRVVEVKPNGWNVVPADQAPVRFRRPATMQPLPEPKPEGSLADLAPFVRAKGDGFTLTVAWLVGALAPRGPYAALSLHGEQGAAKSTTARIVRSLIDPSKADLRKEPQDSDALIIAAMNGRVVAIDNISRLPPWLSDSLCRLATGAGMSKRALYTDCEEVVIEACRPIILTGIEQPAVRGDLMDRCVTVELDVIPEEERQPEAALWAKFEAARPKLLGAVFDAVATALKRRGEVTLDRLPRMADFALWVSAAEQALPWEEGEFLRAYGENRATAHESVLESEPFAVQLLRMLETTGGKWEGTATALHQAVTEQAPEGLAKSKEWPKARGQAVGGLLKRLGPALRAAGLTLIREREAGGQARTLKLQLAPGEEGRANTSQTSHVTAEAKPPGIATESAPAACDVFVTSSSEGAAENVTAAGAPAPRDDLGWPCDEPVTISISENVTPQPIAAAQESRPVTFVTSSPVPLRPGARETYSERLRREVRERSEAEAEGAEQAAAPPPVADASQGELWSWRP